MTMPSNKPPRVLWHYIAQHGAALFALNTAGSFGLCSILDYLNSPIQTQASMRIVGTIIALIYAAVGGWLRWQLKPILIGMFLTTGLFVGNVIALVMMIAALVHFTTGFVVTKIGQAKAYYFPSHRQELDDDSLSGSEE